MTKKYLTNLYLILVLALVFSGVNFSPMTRAAGGVCSIDFFGANPNPVAGNTTTTVQWTTSDCVSVFLSSNQTFDVLSYSPSGSWTSAPLATNSNPTYILNADGLQQSIDIIVLAAPSCSFQSYSGNPLTITAGATAYLSWSTVNCSSVTLNGSAVSGSASNYPVVPSTTTTYTLSADGTSRQVTITVNATPQCQINSFLASPNPTGTDHRTVLSWSTSNCSAVDLTENSTFVPIPNSSTGTTFTLGADTTFVLIAGDATATQDVKIPVGCGIVSFDNTVNASNVATLTWSAPGCTQLRLSGGQFGAQGSGTSVGTSGSITTNTLTQATTYYLDAWNASNIAATKSTTATLVGSNVTVNINAIVNGASVPASAFVYGFGTNGSASIPNNTLGTFSNMPTGIYGVVATLGPDNFVHVLVNGQDWKATAASDSKTAAPGQTITLNLQATTNAVLQIH